MIERIAFVLLAMTSLFAFAKTESPCPRNKTSCYKSAPFTGNGMVHAISHPIEHANENAGVYFARGSGRTCSEAYRNGTRKMMDEFDYLVCGGMVKCGTNGSSYLLNQSCNKTPDGTHYAWVTCSNLFHSPHYTAPESKTGPGFILLQSLIADEKKNGNR